MLREEGLSVVVAVTGEQALSTLERLRPDAVLLDHRLPDMDVTEFAARYRAAPGPHAPIILITADFRPQQIAADIGADAVLAKPFDLAALIQAVGQFLPTGD